LIVGLLDSGLARSFESALFSYFSSVLESGVPAESLLDKVEKFAEATSFWGVYDRKYIPYPAKWFSNGHWDDDPAEWERGYRATTEEDHANGF
jgi:hypothetical protein